jgi:hypothetical protein
MPSRTPAQPVKTAVIQTERKIPLFEKVCPVCNKEFLGAKVAVYDTTACRQKANYARHREAYRKAQDDKRATARKAKAKHPKTS